MLRLEVNPRSLSVIYQPSDLWTLTASRTVRGNEARKTRKYRRKARNPINFQMTPRIGAPRLSKAPFLPILVHTDEYGDETNKPSVCPSMHFEIPMRSYFMRYNEAETSSAVKVVSLL